MWHTVTSMAFLSLSFAETCFGQLNWELKNPLHSSFPFTSITYGKNRFVAVSENDTIFTSPDGTTWTKNSTGIKRAPLNSIAFGSNHFVAVGDVGTVLVSPEIIPGIIKNGEKYDDISPLIVSCASNLIFVKVPQAYQMRQFGVQLFSIAGKSIYHSIAQPHNGIIDIPVKDCSHGEYLLTITDRKGINLFSRCILAK